MNFWNIVNDFKQFALSLLSRRKITWKWNIIREGWSSVPKKESFIARRNPRCFRIGFNSAVRPSSLKAIGTLRPKVSEAAANLLMLAFCAIWKDNSILVALQLSCARSWSKISSSNVAFKCLWHSLTLLSFQGYGSSWEELLRLHAFQRQTNFKIWSKTSV